MEKTWDILNVGIMVADMPLKIPYEVLDFMVDSIKLDDVTIIPGGDATNSAIVQSRLGKKAAVAAKVGDDDFGHIVKKIVEKRGADTRYVKVDPDSRTSISVVVINAKGDRSFLFYPGSLQDFSLEDIDIDALKSARHVNLGSLFAHPKLDRGGAEELFKLAKTFGATTSADVTHDSHGTGFTGIRGLLRYVDYFMPSYIEGKYLSGETMPEKMADFFIKETGDKTVVIKMGEEGCFIRSRGKSIKIRPYKVKAIDTTGAGDNFVAGFLTGLSNGWELEQCGEFANAVAGYSVQFLGATTEEMSMEHVMEFMKKTPR